VLALVMPFLRREASAGDDGLGAFSGQLEELERDRELGLIEAGEARAAGIDIRRRRIAATEAGDEAEPERASPILRQIAILVCGAGGLVAVALYMMLGSPQLIGQSEPAPAELSAEMQAVMEQVDALAADLAANPDDPRGWAVLGQAYLSMGRWSDARDAFSSAIDLVPDSAFLFSSLGQALLFDEGGRMTPAAREAFARAVELDPTDTRARLFMAEAQYQAGEVEAAIAAWQVLLEETPEDAPARAMIEARLASVPQSAAEADASQE
jgi:cytochrome c-type biogenesis protein CcmH